MRLRPHDLDFAFPHPPRPAEQPRAARDAPSGDPLERSFEFLEFPVPPRPRMCVAKDGTRLHQLVHASKHVKGFVAMKEAMNTSIGDSLLPETVRDAITLDVAVGDDALLKAVIERFGGNEVRWTETGGVKEFLDCETSAFPRQVQRLKGRMKELGWQVSGRPIVLAVPLDRDD